MQIDFPEDIGLYSIVNSKASLENQLRIELQLNNLAQFLSYRVWSATQKYLYARCRKCNAYLSFRRTDQNTYELVKAKRRHQHRQIRNVSLMIKEYIKSLPMQLSAISIRTLTNQKFNISNSSFYRLFNQVRYESLKFSQLAQNLKDEGFLGYYEPINIHPQQLPSLLIITSQESKKAFQTFGDFVSFDITYNMFREKSIIGQDYRLGILAGVSGAFKLLPFALIITDNETAEQIAKIFYQLFKIFQKVPHTIITDEQASIKAGLNILRYEDIWQGQHILDSYHLLKNAKKKLKQKSNISYFKNALAAKSQNQLEHYEKEASQNMEESDLTVFDRFLEDYSYSCYCSSQKLIGFGTSSSGNQKLNDIVKSLVPRSQRMLYAAKNIAIKFKHMIKNNMIQIQLEKQRLEDLLAVKELKQIRKNVSKKVMNKLVQVISRSIRCLTRTEDDKIYVEDQFGEVVIAILENELYDCSCKYRERSGIPCEHIIKLVLLHNLKIRPYISDRWLMTEYIEGFLKKRNGIKHPRKTRRNKLK